MFAFSLFRALFIFCARIYQKLNTNLGPRPRSTPRPPHPLPTPTLQPLYNKRVIYTFKLCYRGVIEYKGECECKWGVVVYFMYILQMGEMLWVIKCAREWFLKWSKVKNPKCVCDGISWEVKVLKSQAKSRKMLKVRGTGGHFLKIVRMCWWFRRGGVPSLESQNR